MSTTTFVQYKYCSLCRASCKKWRKHVHSPRHQEIVTNILKKFMKKVTDSKSCIEHPVIKDANWKDAARKVWCYSCSCDVHLHLSKTTVVGECIIVSAGFLGHITRKDHSENTAKFLKDNLVDMKKTAEFLLDNDIFLRFLESAEKVSVEYLNEKSKELKKAANAIRVESALHRHVMNQGLLEQKRQQQLTIHANTSVALEDKQAPSHLKNSRSDQEEGERKKTAHAFGDGLTAIERHNEDDSEGNIHSNAVPPWLRPDGAKETSNDGIIGPSISDWNKHKKLEQKRKLPACRVGAKFDHERNQGDEWLPSFGGVWSHGPRTKASAQFKRRFDSSHNKWRASQSKQNPLNQAVSSSSSSSSSSLHISSSDNNATPQTDLYHASKSEAFSRLQIPSENKLFKDIKGCDSRATNDIGSTPSKSFVSSTNHSVSDYFSSSSSFGTKNVRPYVSKRRKIVEEGPTSSNSIQTLGFMQRYENPTDNYSSSHFSTKASKPYISKKRKEGESTSANATSIQSSAYQEMYNYNAIGNFSSTHFRSPVRDHDRLKSSSNHNGQYSDNSNSLSTSSVRLLHTPVLAKK